MEFLETEKLTFDGKFLEKNLKKVIKNGYLWNKIGLKLLKGLVQINRKKAKLNKNLIFKNFKKSLKKR